MVSLFGLLYNTLINPNFGNDMVAESLKSMDVSGLITSDLAIKTEEFRNRFSASGQFFQAIVGQSVVGTFFSLLISLFFRSQDK